MKKDPSVKNKSTQKSSQIIPEIWQFEYFDFDLFEEQ